MFEDLDEFLDPGFRTTVRGVEYRVGAPSAVTVLRLLRLLETDGFVWSVDVEHQQLRTLLGATWDRMTGDGVAEEAQLRFARAVLVHCTRGAAAGRRYVETGTLSVAGGAADPDVPGDDSAPGTYGPTDPGGGPYRPEYGDREWYNPPQMAPAFRPPRHTVTWRDLFKHWTALELDFQGIGLDLGGGLLERRSWRWFTARVSAFVDSESSHVRRAITSAVMAQRKE